MAPETREVQQYFSMHFAGIDVSFIWITVPLANLDNPTLWHLAPATLSL
jgi:hypothetical protein